MPPVTVSVVVPLYNKEKSLRRTLDSILSQTCGDLELIVVDDGSTDSSLDVVKDVRDRRLLLISQPNGGPGAARNRGVREARGQFLAFLDADDEWLPDFLEKSIAALTAAPDCGFSLSAFYDGPERRNSQDHLNKRGYKAGKYTVGPKTKPDSFDWLLHAYLPSTSVFRREAFESCGGFYDKYKCKFGEDMYLFVGAALQYPFWRLGEPLVWYHSEDSALASQRQLLTPLLLDPQPLLQRCPEENKPILRGLLADRAIQESLGQAYRGYFGDWQKLYERFDCLKLAGRRARNARRQILSLQMSPSPFRRVAPGLLRRGLNRLFPLSSD